MCWWEEGGGLPAAGEAPVREDSEEVEMALFLVAILIGLLEAEEVGQRYS